MLVQFKFNNIYSFYKEQIFSMVSAPIRASKSQYNNTLQPTNNVPPLLLSAALYGANSSGKSNFVKTIDFFLQFINNSAYYMPETIIQIPVFLLNSNSAYQSSSFEITFIINNIIYRYGYQLNNNEILGEWLYIKNEREAMIYKRENQNFEINSKYKISKDLIKKNMIRKNVLLLSVAAQFNEPTAVTMFQWFTNCIRISGLNDFIFRNYTQNLLKNENYKQKILNLLKSADLCIEDIILQEAEIDTNSFSIQFNVADVKVEPMQQQKSILQNLNTLKNRFNDTNEPDGQVEMNFDFYESEGTKKLFHLSGLFFNIIANGGVMIIDEFDAKLHSHLTTQLISIINNPKINKKGAQLIFTTHNTNLLSANIFRRDQIWFTQKNLKNETHLFSLYEFKQRNDSDIEKNYMAGRFGAVPFLNNIDEVFN